MNTYVFDSTGACVMAVNSFFPAEDFPDRVVVHAEEDHMAVNVWYDHVNNRMSHRTEFDVTVTTNTISDIPTGTTAVVGESVIEVVDGVLELDVTYPQTVTVVLTHPAYRMEAVEVPCEVQA